ncbi:MAG: ATP-binding protein [Chloroflexota bacterium]
MATAEQLKSLIRSHYNNEVELFSTVALQVAAHEAKQGHTVLAVEIQQLVDSLSVKGRGANRHFHPDLKGLVLSEDTQTPKSALVIPEDLNVRIDRIIHEYRQRAKLKKYGLMHRRKILLIGPPGTGKTMTASVLANELHLTLNTIQVDRLVTKFMGESSAKLRLIFDLIERETAVYFFDEFDAIGGDRALDNDVGEMRRILNAFLQFIEQDRSDSVIIAATNNPGLLDQALFRRFDDILYFGHPEEDERKRLVENLLSAFIPSRFSWKKVVEEGKGLSHAEIDHACRDALKETILSDDQAVSSAKLIHALQERQKVNRNLLESKSPK